MERNTLTKVKELKMGDRFRKKKDSQKEVWQIVQHEVKKTYFQTYSFFAKRDMDKHATPFKAETEVIFLRHTQEHEQPQPAAE